MAVTRISERLDAELRHDWRMARHKVSVQTCYRFVDDGRSAADMFGAHIDGLAPRRARLRQTERYFVELCCDLVFERNWKFENNFTSR